MERKKSGVNEGIIIKFYREQASMTQEQLGLGICSTTHISKIERGLTEFSPEITLLLAQRLGIDIEQEVNNLSQIKEKLDMWHEMIISLNLHAASMMEKELTSNQLIEIPMYKSLFYLLSLKYNLKEKNLSLVPKLLKMLPKNGEGLPEFELNLYKHVMGIYYMLIENNAKSIETLKSIDYDKYSNALIYYDLATAYYLNNSFVLAYYYAEKALRLYKRKNNFFGIVDAENLMLIQIASDQNRDFKETHERYQNLIQLCDLCHSPDQKAKLLHNFAYENFKRKKYPEASNLYKQSMHLKKENTEIYLLSLEGYIRSSFQGGLLSKEALLKYVYDGLTIAKEINNTLYVHALTLHKYAILQRKKQYFHYIENKALPFFKKHGHTMEQAHYEKELFNYYYALKDTEKALQVAAPIIQRST